MTRIQNTLLSVFAPHARAERLVDARLDAHRASPALEASDEAWLDAHLEACDDCRAMAEARAEAVAALRQAPKLRASEGFAARVAAAARAEAEAGRREAHAAPPRLEPVRRPFTQWAFAGAAVAATVTFAVLVGPNSRAPEGTVEVSGAAAVAAEAPDFDVRAPSLGAAELRAVVSKIATAHAGQVEPSGSALTVRIPRAELVGMLRDLSRAGEVSVTPRSELDPEKDSVVLRVSLD